MDHFFNQKTKLVSVKLTLIFLSYQNPVVVQFRLLCEALKLHNKGIMGNSKSQTHSDLIVIYPRVGGVQTSSLLCVNTHCVTMLCGNGYILLEVVYHLVRVPRFACQCE